MDACVGNQEYVLRVLGRYGENPIEYGGITKSMILCWEFKMEVLGIKNLCIGT